MEDLIIDTSAWNKMKGLGGNWFAYQNKDLGHPGCGHIQYLKCGEGCTYSEPPGRYPDTDYGIGWRYLLKGKVDLEDGFILEGVTSCTP